MVVEPLSPLPSPLQMTLLGAVELASEEVVKKTLAEASMMGEVTEAGVTEVEELPYPPGRPLGVV